MGLFSRKSRGRWKPEIWITPEERAASLLSIALAENDGEDEEIVVLDKELGRKLRAEAELQGRASEEESGGTETRVAEHASALPAREKLRMLMLTTDISLFTVGGAVEAEYGALGAYLDELHIIVLTLRRERSYVARRIAPNVWVYPTNSRSRLFALYDAYLLARRQVAFAAGFRADVVIATDSFEAGLAGYAIARRHDRPLQLQLSVNPFTQEFLAEHPGNKWRALSARFVSPRADGILARAERLKTALERRYPARKGRITVLPPFRHLAVFKDAIPAFNLHERYPQFKFVILLVSRLEAESMVDFAIDACAPIIRQYPTIGLVIVGDGPGRERLAKKVLAANLQNKIVFEPETDDLASHMKTANLFLNVSADEEHDMLLAAAAAAGLPVLTVASDMASTLFEDNINAFVCPEHDMVCLQARIGEFLNDNQLRTAFSINARDRVFSAIEQDVHAYREKLIGSIESCVVAAYATANKEEA